MTEPILALTLPLSSAPPQAPAKGPAPLPEGKGPHFQSDSVPHPPMTQALMLTALGCGHRFLRAYCWAQSEALQMHLEAFSYPSTSINYSLLPVLQALNSVLIFSCC